MLTVCLSALTGVVGWGANGVLDDFEADATKRDETVAIVQARVQREAEESRKRDDDRAEESRKRDTELLAAIHKFQLETDHRLTKIEANIK